MLYEHGGQRVEFLTGIDSAGGIAGTVEHQQTCARRDGGFQFVGRHFQTVPGFGGHSDGHAFGQLDHLDIADPRRSRDHNLVAGIDQGQQHIGQLMLGTVAHDDLRWSELQAVLLAELAAYRLAQTQISGNRCIARIIIIDCFLGRLLDKIGRIEIGLAGCHAYHIDALCLQFVGLGKHRQSR